MLTLVLSAAAGPVFESVTPEASMEVPGNWPRAFLRDNGGFWMLNAANGEYWVRTADADFVPDSASARALTGHRDLQDHAVTMCPDGTFLHIASASVVDPNDSMYAFHYDDAWNLIGESTIDEANPVYWNNDMPIICSEQYRGTGRMEPEGGVTHEYIALTEDLEIESITVLNPLGPHSIGSMYFESHGLLSVFGAPAKDGLGGMLDAYSTDITLYNSVTPTLMAPPWAPSWTQAAVRYGETTIVVHLATDLTYQWDTLGADLWITAYDNQWVQIDQLQLSTNTAPIGGLQPGMVLNGNHLLVYYTKEQANLYYDVTLAEAVTEDTGGTPPDDTGPAETDTEPTDEDDTDTDILGEVKDEDTGVPSSVCGCATTRTPTWAPLLVGLLAFRRRR